MKVYVVVTNGDVNGEIEGVYQTHEKAKTKFDEMIDDWRGWFSSDESAEENVSKDYYSISSFDGEYEVQIIETELL